MKKIIMILIISFFAFSLHVEAKTKQDIIDYVYNNAQCGTETAIFQSYNKTYNRLLKEKQITDSEISEILKQLEISYGIINKHKICKLSDIDKLNDETKQKLFDALDAGARIIHNAPSITNPDEKPDIDSSPIVYDRDQKTINIYDGDVLIDRIPLETQKLTYTGPNIYLTYSLIAFAGTLTIALIFYSLAKKHHKARFYKKVVADFLWGFVFTTGLILTFMLIFNNQIDAYYNLKNMLRNINITENINKEIILDEENNIVVYPAYGNRYAELLIPNLGIASDISFGDAPFLLKNNIGHHTPSSFPGEGETIIYSGHNNEEHLKNLEKIELEDQIIINASYGQFVYQVDKVAIINDSDWHLLKGEGETLILYTCYPFSRILYGSKRYVVYAELVEAKWNEGGYYE